MLIVAAAGLFFFGVPLTFADTVSQTDASAMFSAPDLFSPPIGLYGGFTYTYSLGNTLSGTLDSLILKFDGRVGGTWEMQFFCRTGSNFVSGACSTSDFGSATGFSPATTGDGTALYTATWSGTKTFELGNYYLFQLRTVQGNDFLTPATISGSADASSYAAGLCDQDQSSDGACTAVAAPYFELNSTPVTPPTPVLSAVSIASNNASTTFAKVGDTVTVSATSTLELGVVTATIAGQAAIVATSTAATSTASYQFTATDTEGPIAFSFSYASLAGASGFTTSTTTNDTSVVFDKTLPGVAIDAGPADGSATSTALITFFFTATDTNLASVSCAWDGAATSTCALSASSTLADGAHTFSVVAADAAGNTVTVSRSFSVDTTAPVISGTPSDIFVEATAASTTVTYTLPTAADVGDGATTTVSCTPASGYGFSLGSTTVACSTSDSVGNTATSSFAVGVRDTIAPVISMTGGDMSLTVGDTFTDPGATATDLGASVTVVATGTVNTAVAGTYILTYTATDASLNVATTTRTITVSAAPPPPPPPSGGGGGNGPPVENPSQGLPQGVVLGTQTQSVQNASPRAVERIEQVQPPAHTAAPGNKKSAKTKNLSAAVPAKTPVEGPRVAAAAAERPAPTVWDVPAPQSNTAAVATAGSGYAIPLWAWLLAGLAALASLAFWRLRK